MAESIEYWIQKCSICFDSRHDFCVEKCRDQFCFGCFDKYVNELLNHAWGMSMFEVKCPVCSEILPEHEWTQYVRPETSRRFRQLNRPYPVFTRFCVACDTANPAVAIPDPGHQITEADFVSIIEMMEKSGFFTTGQIELFQDECFKYMQDSDRRNVPLISLYRLFLHQYRESLEQSIMPYSYHHHHHHHSHSHSHHSHHSSHVNNSSVNDRNSYENSNTTYNTQMSSSSSSSSGANYFDTPTSTGGKRKRSRGPSFTERLSVALISSRLIALETKPDSWKELQFMHISNFSQGKCSHCDRAICFKCGESTWHKGMSCEIYLARKVENKKGSTDTLANLKWKLSNSKACPNCCIFIARDEGCNKVDCVNCGHRFCWICLKPWSEDCGFFRCAEEKNLNPVTDQDNLKKKSDSTAAEIKEEDSSKTNYAATTPRQLIQEKTENGVPNVYKLFSLLGEKQQQQPLNSSSQSSHDPSSSPPIPPALPQTPVQNNSSFSLI